MFAFLTRTPKCEREANREEKLNHIDMRIPLWEGIGLKFLIFDFSVVAFVTNATL